MGAEKSYQLGDTTYQQRPLVLGQVRQLIELLDGVEFAPAAGAAGVVAALGDKLPLALAVVLTPAGSSPRGKDLPALADEIEFAVAPEQVLEVVEDFFDCNPVASLLERLTGMTARVSAQLARMRTAPTGSSIPASCSAAATSPDATPCCGDTPSPSAAPGSTTDSVK